MSEIAFHDQQIKLMQQLVEKEHVSALVTVGASVVIRSRVTPIQKS
jgi:hypothetical protein